MQIFLALGFAFLVILFPIWNNFPQMIERIGLYFVAHSRAMRYRSYTYAKLLLGQWEE